mmetsp:Transcript_127537/g.291494  ORF Transcript_127537/g.291494 Transcript_127537/m.291494 type:complete len:369 (-) Transcript_127537:52-1158(-)
MACPQTLVIPAVYVDGCSGQFRANTDRFGWKGWDGSVIEEDGLAVKAVQWRDGKIRILLTGGDLLAFDGFDPDHFDTLWLHFRTYYKVVIKRVKKGTLTGEAVDDAWGWLEEQADLVDAAPAGSAMKKARELDLLGCADDCRRLLQEALAGDKATLGELFAGDRIGCLRLVLDTVRTDHCDTEERWRQLREACAAVEDLLQGLGACPPWKPKEGVQSESIMKRHALVGARLRKKGSTVGAEAALEEIDESCAETDVEEAESICSVPPPVADVASFTSSFRSGWIWKQSRYLRQWRRRWLVLSGATLATFKSAADVVPTESISRLKIVELRAGSGTTPVLVICLRSGREVEIAFDSRQDRDEWLAQLAV